METKEKNGRKTRGVKSIKIVLEDRKYLKVKRVTKIDEVIEEKNKPGKTKKDYYLLASKTELLETFPLRKIEVEELKMLRDSKLPGFVLKEKGNYFYAQINEKLNLVSDHIIGTHKCAAYRQECARFSAASDRKDGCAKVREGCREIERYEWITLGYETFNTCNDVFVVIECNHYRRHDTKTKISEKREDALKMSLAQYRFEYVRTFEEVQYEVEKTGATY